MSSFSPCRIPTFSWCFADVLGSQAGCGESGLPYWVWCRKQDFQVTSPWLVTWHDRLASHGSFLLAHFPRVLKLTVVHFPPCRLSTCGLQPVKGVVGVCRLAAVSEVEVDEVSRCSTSVWTADTAALVCLCALNPQFRVLYCWSDTISVVHTVQQVTSWGWLFYLFVIKSVIYFEISIFLVHMQECIIRMPPDKNLKVPKLMWTKVQ